MHRRSELFWYRTTHRRSELFCITCVTTYACDTSYAASCCAAYTEMPVLTPVTWLIRMRDVTQAYMWHDSFVRVTSTCTWMDIHTYIHTIHVHVDVPLWYMWHDSFIFVTWLVHICDMTRLRVWCDLLSGCTFAVWHDFFVRECTRTHKQSHATHAHTNHVHPSMYM